MKSANRIKRLPHIFGWGVAVMAVLGVVLLGATARAQSSTVEVLFRFPGFNPIPPTAPIGMLPRARLLEVTPGQFFGTTSQGGTGPCNNGDGCGTVFVLDTSSTLTVLHHFQGVTAGDGAFPYAGLVYVPSDGHLYGTTRQGGDPTCSSPSGPGCGTIFRIMPDGSDYGVVYSFEAGATDGLWPEAALLLGSDGNLYGTTRSGGSPGGGGFGTLFKVTPPFDPPVTPVFFAVGTTAVTFPNALMQASNGTIYGIGVGGLGTIFSLDPATVTPTVLATTLDGANIPNGPLVDPGDGFLYGTARNGGAHNGGTVFRFDTTALTVQTVYSFGSVANDAIFPQAGLALSADGSTLYGVTPAGGDPMVCGVQDGCGTIFSILTGPPNPATVLHSFITLGQATDDGSWPLAELILGSDGASFYGTLYRYGGNSCGPPPRACNGTIFSFTP